MNHHKIVFFNYPYIHYMVKLQWVYIFAGRLIKRDTRCKYN